MPAEPQVKRTVAFIDGQNLFYAAKYDEQRRQLEAQQPTSDFDKAVEDVKRIGQQKPPKQLPPGNAPSKPRRKPKGKGVGDGK